MNADSDPNAEPEIEPSAGPDPVSPAEHAAAARRASNIRFLVAAIVSASAIAWVATTSFDSQVYFLTVSELETRGDDVEGEEFRIKGNVVRDSHRIREGTLDEHLFTLVDAGKTLEVYYRGALPDTFSNDAEVVALGRLNEAGTFEAVEVVAKCPSRYESVPPTAAAAR